MTPMRGHGMPCPYDMLRVILNEVKNLSLRVIRYFTSLRSVQYDTHARTRRAVSLRQRLTHEYINAAGNDFCRIYCLYIACQSIVELACDYLYWYLIFGATAQAHAADADVVGYLHN